MRSGSDLVAIECGEMGDVALNVTSLMVANIQRGFLGGVSW